MCIEARVVEVISNHMNEHWERVAGVLVGPKREGWFTSESFVALSQNVNPLEDDGFSVYGEQALSTVLNRVGWSPAGGEPRRFPDLVGYFPDATEPLAFILEAKLIYVDDPNPQRVLDNLAGQLANAHEVVPGVPVIGLVFIASSPAPGDASSEIERLGSLMETCLPSAEGYSWVDGNRVSVLSELDQARPDWESFNCYSTLAIGARVRS